LFYSANGQLFQFAFWYNFIMIELRDHFSYSDNVILKSC